MITGGFIYSDFEIEWQAQQKTRMRRIGIFFHIEGMMLRAVRVFVGDCLFFQFRISANLNVDPLNMGNGTPTKESGCRAFSSISLI